MYEEKTARRQAITIELDELDLAIPLLEKTLRALEAQLGEVPDPAEVISSFPARDGLGRIKEKIRQQIDRISSDPIPPAVRAQLPPEDFSKFGSHFGDARGEKTEDEFLPPIEGKPVIPEKKQ